MEATSPYLNEPLRTEAEFNAQRAASDDADAAATAREAHRALVAGIVKSLRDEPEDLRDEFLAEAYYEATAPGGSRGFEEQAADEQVEDEKRNRRDALHDALVRDAKEALDTLETGLHDDDNEELLREAATIFDSLACRLLALIDANEIINKGNK